MYLPCLHKYINLWGYKSFCNLACVEEQLEYELALCRQSHQIENSFNCTQAISVSVFKRWQIYSDKKLHNEVHT